MRKFRIIIVYISIAIIIGMLTIIDYKNLLSRQNLGSFLGIIAMLFNIFAMILSNRNEAKKQNDRS